jgi:hypothetical protein
MTARSPSTCSTSKRIEGSVAVGRRTGALHHAVVGDEVDELLGCPLEEGGIVLVDDSGGVVHGRIVRGAGLRSNSLESIASKPGVGNNHR